MAAVPFGGGTSFAEYLDWARKQGCTVEFGVLYADDGRSAAFVRINAPSGRWAIEAGVDQDEYIMPTTVNRLDRRLGLKSPFFSLPGPNDE